jgi:hypothetical protein
MKSIKHRLKIEPLDLGVRLAFLAGLIVTVYDPLLPIRLLSLGAKTMALSLALEESLVGLLLMMLLIIVAQWIAEKTHEYLSHFHPRAGYS